MHMGSNHRNGVLAHYPANTTVANVKAQLLQFFGHSWTAVAAQRQLMLLSNVRQKHHIRALASAHWTGAKSPKATRANIHDLAQTFGWNFPTVFFNEPKPSRALLRNTLPGSAIMVFGSRRTLLLFLGYPSPHAEGGSL